jgi:hypothetical protein
VPYQLGKTAKVVPSFDASPPNYGVSFYICICFQVFQQISIFKSKKKNYVRDYYMIQSDKCMLESL